MSLYLPSVLPIGNIGKAMYLGACKREIQRHSLAIKMLRLARPVRKTRLPFGHCIDDDGANICLCIFLAESLFPVVQ